MHYSVLAITEGGSERDLAEAMAPYDENLRVAPYVAETRADFIARLGGWAGRLADEAAALRADPKAEAEAMAKDPRRTEWLLRGEGARIASLAGKGDAAFAEFAAIDGGEFDAEGNRLSTYNPDSRYDYYSVGGMGDALPLLSGGWADDADSDEVDWDGLFARRPKDLKEAESFWRAHVLGEPYPGMTAEETAAEVDSRYGPLLYKPEWYLAAYGDLEGYLASVGFGTYAILDGPSGEWLSPGKMGWFSSSETPEGWGKWRRGYADLARRLAKPGTHVWVLDLHI